MSFKYAAVTPTSRANSRKDRPPCFCFKRRITASLVIAVSVCFAERFPGTFHLQHSGGRNFDPLHLQCSLVACKRCSGRACARALLLLQDLVLPSALPFPLLRSTDFS